MGEDLQSLLEKINRDGVEKATAEAGRIVAEAKAKAVDIVKTAKAEAEKAKADGEKAAADYAARAAETVAQAARDTILKIEAAVTALLERVLAQNVDKTLADEANLSALVFDAVKGLVDTADVAVPAALVPALKARLAAQPHLTVTTDETLGTGFSVRLDGGRVEHTFTGEAITGELVKRLRPDLAKLVR
jgi:V/A-type H+-transporting ATPase subunit E